MYTICISRHCHVSVAVCILQMFELLQFRFHSCSFSFKESSNNLARVLLKRLYVVFFTTFIVVDSEYQYFMLVSNLPPSASEVIERAAEKSSSQVPRKFSKIFQALQQRFRDEWKKLLPKVCTMPKFTSS